MSSPVLAPGASDAEIICYVDHWVALLAGQKFTEAVAFIPGSDSIWTADLLADVLASYGDDQPNHVTLLNDGTALDGADNLHPAQQRKEVDWHGPHGEVWYDLNINGRVSDLTATFTVIKTATQLTIQLDDVHVM